MNLEGLLKQVAAISTRYELVYQKTGELFNIFDVAHIGTDEVVLCRVIYELLNPRGSHYQGNIYLGLFLRYVLDLNPDVIDWHSVKVHREYVIENGRRIDLVIETKDLFLPIEVKIYASDQSGQCMDYVLRSHCADLYYLTLDGHLPSPESVGSLTTIQDNHGNVTGYAGVRLISFRREILLWLGKCLEQRETIRIGSIREVIMQLEALLRKLTNQSGKDQNMETVDLLTSSRECMKAAVEIERSLADCKKKIMIKLFQSLEAGLAEHRLSNQYDYAASDFQLVKEFTAGKWKYPGISFPRRRLNNTNVDLWLRIEIGPHLYAGFVMAVGNIIQTNDIHLSDLDGVLRSCKIDGVWAYAEELPVNNVSHSPNFMTMNEEYFDLFDTEKYDHFIGNCLASIRKIDGLLI